MNYDPYNFGRFTGSGNTSGIPSPTETFGSRVGQIATPNPYSDLSAIYPNLGGTNAAVSSAISTKLAGQLSPETLAGIQDDAARYGVSSGMPGLTPDSMASHYGLYRGALARENLTQQGVQDYNATIPTISSTQTVRPETQFAIGEQNAVNAAAPDPAAASSYAQQLFYKYLNALKPASPSGGTGTYGNRPIDWISKLGPGTRQTGSNRYSTPIDPSGFGVPAPSFG